MENVRFLQGVKQYFCTKALDVILHNLSTPWFYTSPL